ncbi:MAG: hypothetical protein Q9162_006778 [Coniocarpon cinnabarinum]
MENGKTPMEAARDAALWRHAQWKQNPQLINEDNASDHDDGGVNTESNSDSSHARNSYRFGSIVSDRIETGLYIALNDEAIALTYQNQPNELSAHVSHAGHRQDLAPIGTGREEDNASHKPNETWLGISEASRQDNGQDDLINCPHCNTNFFHNPTENHIRTLFCPRYFNDPPKYCHLWASKPLDVGKVYAEAKRRLGDDRVRDIGEEKFRKDVEKAVQEADQHGAQLNYEALERLNLEPHDHGEPLYEQPEDQIDVQALERLNLEPYDYGEPFYEQPAARNAGWARPQADVYPRRERQLELRTPVNITERARLPRRARLARFIFGEHRTQYPVRRQRSASERGQRNQQAMESRRDRLQRDLEIMMARRNARTQARLNGMNEPERARRNRPLNDFRRRRNDYRRENDDRHGRDDEILPPGYTAAYPSEHDYEHAQRSIEERRAAAERRQVRAAVAELCRRVDQQFAEQRRRRSSFSSSSS